MITARGSYCRFSKTRLFPHEAIRAAIEAALSATERLSECYPISMRHHIIQDRIYCAARRSEWRTDMKREKWRRRKMNWFKFLLQNMERLGPQFSLQPFVLISNINKNKSSQMISICSFHIRAQRQENHSRDF